MNDIRSKLREWSLDRTLARNVISLYGVQFANYLLPLITIPYLTRVLGPAMWGLVAFAQAFGAYVAVGIGYGFDLSASREVAKNLDSKTELANLVAGVMGAKLLLAIGAVALAFLVEPWIPLFRRILGGPPILQHAVVLPGRGTATTDIRAGSRWSGSDYCRDFHHCSPPERRLEGAGLARGWHAVRWSRFHGAGL